MIESRTQVVGYLLPLLMVAAFCGACKGRAQLDSFQTYQGRWVGDASGLKATIPAGVKVPELDKKLGQLAKTTLAIEGNVLRFNGPAGNWSGRLSPFATTSRSVAAHISRGEHDGKRCTLSLDAKGKLLLELEGEKRTFWLFRADVL
jgi:hypothetical protein